MFRVTERVCRQVKPLNHSVGLRKSIFYINIIERTFWM